MVGYLAQLGAPDPRIRLAWWPSHQYIDRVLDIAQANLLPEFVGFESGDVAGTGVQLEPAGFRPMEIGCVGSGRQFVDLHGSYDGAAFAVEAEADPASPGEEVQQPRRAPARQPRQLAQKR